uniref:AraC family transcriptional regulator n=1 Tax=OCS116 cluster bacterium TaxID=2030921 RepID=A0A2A4Z1U5_9PROT
MILEILPQHLFSMPNVNALLRHQNTTIMHKILHQNLLDKEMYLSSVALLYIIKGEQSIGIYDAERVQVEQGQLLYLPKDIYLVSDFIKQNDSFEAVLFFIDDDMLDKLRPLKIEKPEIQTHRHKPLILSTNQQMAKYVGSLIDVYAGQENNPQLLEIKLLELLALVKFQHDGDDFLDEFYSRSLMPKKRDIREFMHQHYLQNLKIEDYAHLTGRSVSTFNREFKAFYEATPHQWLIEQRLVKAHEMLSEGKANVTQTALAVGYDNVSHFISAYKKKYKQTPKQTKIGK